MLQQRCNTLHARIVAIGDQDVWHSVDTSSQSAPVPTSGAFHGFLNGIYTIQPARCLRRAAHLLPMLAEQHTVRRPQATYHDKTRRSFTHFLK
jgi:hypothetical protein